MRKVLLIMSALSIVGVSQAQTIVSENFESLTTGNVGTNVAGSAAGQNGWYTLYGANTDYQITTIDATHGKSMTISSYNSYDTTTNSTLNSRIAAKLTTVTATTGNNIVHGKFDLYTGPSTGTGTIQFRVLGTNGTTSSVIGGFMYNVATKELRGLATFTNLSTFTAGTYTITLASGSGLILTANTWYTLDFQYNKTTGAYTWYWPTGSGSIAASTSTISLIPGMVAEDLYLYNVVDTGNTVSKIGGFDNILVEFSNASLLSTNDLSSNIKAEKIELYPNPVSDYLNIKSNSKVENVSVYDFNGRKINVKMEGNKVDVSSLPSGNYLINIETKEGKTTEKFIKK